MQKERKKVEEHNNNGRLLTISWKAWKQTFMKHFNIYIYVHTITLHRQSFLCTIKTLAQRRKMEWNRWDDANGDESKGCGRQCVCAQLLRQTIQQVLQVQCLMWKTNTKVTHNLVSPILSQWPCVCWCLVPKSDRTHWAEVLYIYMYMYRYTGIVSMRSCVCVCVCVCVHHICV